MPKKSFAGFSNEEDELYLRIHAFEPFSQSNGPGIRAVIWTQGCPLGCPGCFNPETHPSEGGNLIAVSQLVERILYLRPYIEGITLSGGEPLVQLPAVIKLLERIRTESTLSVVCFTGYTWKEVQRMPRSTELLALLDVLLTGRYTPKKLSNLPFAAHKRVHFLTSRYTKADFANIPAAEVWIEQDGGITVTGTAGVQLG
ncbi:MAG: 4Fe-4S single cluster domain-containing protein [Bacteroidia bacterium]|nr:radical SAM protein [Bacteroidia bacterium]MDW8135002.1 4Fe-4S single cluster domain-containing protein [Bacteroidia bacterium]